MIFLIKVKINVNVSVFITTNRAEVTNKLIKIKKRIIKCQNQK